VETHRPIDRLAADSVGAALAFCVLLALSLTPRTAVAESERSGASLYHDYCSVCHGDRGRGDSRARAGMVPPPRDFTTPAAASDLTRPRMLAAVRDGRPGTAMTSWSTQLSEADMESVVSYIRESLMLAVATEDAEWGRRIYAETCSVCHGDEGRGARWTMTNLDPKPRNFTRAETRSELTRDQMIQAATFGRPDTAMPGFARQYSAEDLNAVVDYILAAFVPPLPTSPDAADPGAAAGTPAASAGSGQGVDMTRAMPNQLVGDPGRGSALYLANCAACHGVEGDGRGPRAYFILPKPRNFQHPGSKNLYNRPALFQAIAKGSLGAEMPAWDTVFDGQQIADVAEFVFRAFIRGQGMKMGAEG